MLIDDISHGDLTSALGTRWRVVTDTVMGGVSDAILNRTVVAGRTSLRLTGTVSLANNGGFVQAALDLAEDGLLDATKFHGVRLVVFGNDEDYNVHLRTADVTAPWQSYRATFHAPSAWTDLMIPFAEFSPHRLNVAMDLTRLKRLGLVAIGRAFHADLSWNRVEFV